MSSRFEIYLVVPNSIRFCVENERDAIATYYDGAEWGLRRRGDVGSVRLIRRERFSTHDDIYVESRGRCEASAWLRMKVEGNGNGDC
jgi:hypothetical protein